ncbi:MAG: hypothetical protein WDN72_02430 [Alphaproteobacteria bacterium]
MVRSVTSCLAAFLAALSLAPPALAVNRTWNNTGSGDWNNGTFWTPSGNPSTVDNTAINNGGTAQVTGTANSDVVTVGTNGGDSGTITVNGASAVLNGSNGLNLGQGGTGTMSLTNGGRFTTNGAINVGNLAGSNGTLTVDGPNSKATGTVTTIGNAGTGVLNITSAAPGR